MEDTKKRGKLIVFEYVDGGDAHPFIQKIEHEFFPNGGLIVDREPTSGLWGGPLGTVLSEDWEAIIHWRLLVHGFLADRVDHITKNGRFGIEKALKRGDFFICDRFNLSTYAYQLPSEENFEWYYTCCEDLLVPDLTIFLKYDIDTCVEHALEIVPTTPSAYSILNRKTARNKVALQLEIERTENMYFKAIDFLKKKTPPHKIEVVEVQDIFSSWFKIKSLIQACLNS